MIRLRTNQDGPALDDSVDVPERVQNAAQAALDADDEGLIPDSCGTGTGTTQANRIANNELVVGDFLRRRDDRSPPPSYLNSHAEDASTDDPPTEWGEDEWSDCGNVGLARWGWYVDWFREKANELAEARGEEQPYTANTLRVKAKPTIRLRTNALGEGDIVELPSGDIGGIIMEGGEDVQIEDEPVGEGEVVVAYGDRQGYEIVDVDELSEGEIDTPDNADPEDLTQVSANEYTANDVGFDSWPDSWEESDIPARIIALDAWSSMGGTWRGCFSEIGDAEICSAFKDEMLGTTAWR